MKTNQTISYVINIYNIDASIQRMKETMLIEHIYSKVTVKLRFCSFWLICFYFLQCQGWMMVRAVLHHCAAPTSPPPPPPQPETLLITVGLSFISVVVIKHSDQKQLREEGFIWLTCPAHSPLSESGQ